ncbi:hypothetical protein RJW51_05215 [Streptococcus parasuis]|uniref:hypothetical protein n=1 Tax=Streptococcus parasuis TaxID=1501662 RepID=UPI002B2829A2|nr:hypothetical protein RJW51_05215 [Streptococcus parasuis]
MIGSLETESEVLGKASILWKSWQEGNARAISFYEKVVFRFDGVKKIVNLGVERTEYRMVWWQQA